MVRCCWWSRLSSQVNQFGGYTGLTPGDFAKLAIPRQEMPDYQPERDLARRRSHGSIPVAAKNIGFRTRRKAGELVHDCVVAGIRKDPSRREHALRRRREGKPHGANHCPQGRCLVQDSEKAYRELPSGSPQLVYVIGTEVPGPWWGICRRTFPCGNKDPKMLIEP